MENRAIDMQEEWVKWNPTNMPEGNYYVTAMIQNGDGTKVILENEKNAIEIFFDGVPVIVRTSVEGIRMRTWGEVQFKYNDKEFFRNWFFYMVENSKLSQWVEEECCGVYEARELSHYCIVTGTELIDVIATFDPTITMREIIAQ